MNLECHGQRSPVNVAIPPTAPSREDIMYQRPGGCIVGKYNVTKKLYITNIFTKYTIGVTVSLVITAHLPYLTRF